MQDQEKIIKKARAVQCIILSQEGSFAVIFAISLMVMISVMAFALDMGYFVKEKSSYQACADSAALSAAESLCYGRAVEAAETVALNSNVLLPEDSVKVQFGFYDSYDEHESFDVYQDFILEDNENYPSSEANNAVMITIENTVQSLTGFNKDKTVKAAAVAYIPRVSVVSGKTITVSSSNQYPLTMENGNIYAKNWIKLYGPSIGENVKVASGKVIRVYNRSEAGNYTNPVERSSDNLPEMEIIEKYLLQNSEASLEEYVEKMKQIADVVYTPEDSRTGPFYGIVQDGNSKDCYFDFSADHDDHKIIFFDTTGSEGSIKVHITPHACLDRTTGVSWWKPSDSINKCMQQIGATEAKGNVMKNFTFIATCIIYIDPYHALKNPVPIGGPGFDQVNLISTGTISVTPGNNPLQGVNFYCNTLQTSTYNGALKNYPDQDNEYYIRAITSTGQIRLRQHIGHDEVTFNFKFGPPCPPITPITLGRLVAAPVSSND